ncbi:winged helix-turn-helix domain-containing protein [Archaeoglobus neptunius]|uniref:winged helix-turn-helix domain-containing protein n=1 Tax=Archaeoglobus neptunius TaxID=2798580 RepID=UPI00192729E9|nr:LysR family transcriptional regulator [Archaeoglobus neptunius]
MNVQFRIWIEKEGEHVIGKGGAKILRAIETEGSISAACKKLGMSYRYVWGYIKKMEKVVGPVVSSSKGGSKGGRTILTKRGREIVEYYEFYEGLINRLVSGDFLRIRIENGKVVGRSVEDGEFVIIRV